MRKAIAWIEGTRITPHFFQQEQLYLESRIVDQLAAQTPYYQGWHEIQLNTDAITQGVIDIVQAQGILGDGYLVEIPTKDPAPLTRSFTQHFKFDQETLTVYLGIPAFRQGIANFSQSPTNGHSKTTRYFQSIETVVDLINGTNTQKLPFLTANLQILFENEELDGYSLLPIACIGRTTTGQYKLVTDYIPPMLSLNQTWLNQNLRSLIDVIVGKTETLGARFKQKSNDVFDLSQSSDFGLFALIHTLNSHLPILLHYLHSEITHPEKLYLQLSQLESQLTSFSDKYQANHIIHYQHENLSNTFGRLFTEIRDLLEIVISTRCVQINLKKVTESAIWTGIIEDPALFEADFILGVAAKVSEEFLLSNSPKYVKIASESTINQIVGTSSPANPISPLSIYPSALPIKPNFRYFQIDTNHHFWKGIQSSKRISVYVPVREFPTPEVELFAIKRM